MRCRPWRKRRDEDEQPDLEGARRKLAEIRAQWPDVHAWTSEARTEKIRNNFGESAQALFLGRKS